MALAEYPALHNTMHKYILYSYIRFSARCTMLVTWESSSDVRRRHEHSACTGHVIRLSVLGFQLADYDSSPRPGVLIVFLFRSCGANIGIQTPQQKPNSAVQRQKCKSTIRCNRFATWAVQTLRLCAIVASGMETFTSPVQNISRQASANNTYSHRMFRRECRLLMIYPRGPRSWNVGQAGTCSDCD